MKRRLYVLMGPPGIGKSTWLKKNKLENYVVSSDQLRMIYGAPKNHEDHSLKIDSTRDRKIWNTLYDIVEDRLEKGELTFVDATNTKKVYWDRYSEIANKHNAEIVCVDFLSDDIDLEEVHFRNKDRDPLKVVPYQVVSNMYKNAKNIKLHSRIKRKSPNEVIKTLQGKINDFSNYEKIYHIGDIHGCIEPLEKFVHEEFDPNNLYIFVGDYVDRGLNNAEVIEMMFELSKRENVIVIEGNHERHLRKWAKNEKSKSRVFNKFTDLELIEKGVSRKETLGFVERLKTFVNYEYKINGGIINVTVNHGGIDRFPRKFPEKYSSEEYIKGIGSYTTDIDEIFTNMSNGWEYQIHGHRNTMLHPTFASKYSFNLEGKIEQGGHMRVVVLSKDGFEEKLYKNDKYSRRFTKDTSGIDNSEFLKELKKDKYINENKEKNITSFNFNRKVFRKSLWDNQRIKARGLFIDHETTEIAARGYDKFFNIEEREDTTLESLKKTLKFPAKLYLKENGFLGILGLNRNRSDLLIASKSSTKTKHAGYFKDMIEPRLKGSRENNLYNLLEEKNLTLLFEVIDPVNDPHIIEYHKPKLVLLDAVKRKKEFEKLPYEELIEIAEEFDFDVKDHTRTFISFEEFEEWYINARDNFDIKEEGYVLEDAAGYHVKIKLPYYSFWKWTRSQVERLSKNKEMSKQYIESELGSKISEKLIKLKEEEPEMFIKPDVIKIRNKINKK